MPINYSRKLTGKARTTDANRHLGFVLAFVGGATNAGGFLVVHQYTSHMTGIVSAVADNVALGTYALAITGLCLLLSFLAGAVCSTIIINYSRRRRLNCEYAFPLLLEASLLLCFGLLGIKSHIDELLMPFMVLLLCFIMGLQNAVITKLSKAEIRTTHLTGIVTDIGIELGKLIYWNSPQSNEQQKVMANRNRLKVLILLAVSFFVGGVAGALGFKHIGYFTTLPLALVLMALAMGPATDDLAIFLRRIW